MLRYWFLKTSSTAIVFVGRKYATPLWYESHIWIWLSDRPQNQSRKYRTSLTFPPRSGDMQLIAKRFPALFSVKTLLQSRSSGFKKGEVREWDDFPWNTRLCIKPDKVLPIWGKHLVPQSMNICFVILLPFVFFILEREFVSPWRCRGCWTRVKTFFSSILGEIKTWAEILNS